MFLQPNLPESPQGGPIPLLSLSPSHSEFLQPTIPKPPKTYEEAKADIDEEFEDLECAITGFPRCVELTDPNGLVRYRTFDVLRPQMDGKVGQILALGMNSRLTACSF